MSRTGAIAAGLVGVLALALLDVGLAMGRLGHPVPWASPATLAVVGRWGLLALGPTLVALVGEVRGRALVVFAGTAAAAAVGAALREGLGGAAPGDALALARDAGAALAAGALGASVARRAPGVLAGLGLVAWVALAPDWSRLRSSPPLPAARPDAPDVLLLTLDTFREDALSASPRALVPGLTPTLDALAARGCRVDGAMAPAPLTGPSHGALLTGRDPAELGLLLNGAVLDADAPRLAHRFQAAGYETAGFVSSAMVSGALGYGRGFAVFDDDLRGDALLRASSVARLQRPRTAKQARSEHFDRPGRDTVARLAAWSARERRRPRFVWVHLYDAHRPYAATPVGAEKVALVDLTTKLPDPLAYAAHPAVGGVPPLGRLLGKLRQHEEGPLSMFLLKGVGAPEPEPVDAPAAWADAAAYLGGIEDVDAIVAEAMAALGEDDARIVAVVGDHGESLTGHNEPGSHQQHLYRENLAVPLLLVNATACPTGPVSTVGVGHALLTAAGVDATAFPAFAEAPMMAWVAGRAHQGDDLTERAVKAAVTVGPHRAIGAVGSWVETYDLSRDPHELDPEAAVPVEIELALDLALGAAAAVEAPDLPADAETRAALQALGYLDE